MKLFCDNCKNLLTSDTSNDVLTFRCMSCHTIYQSTDDDTLRYEEYKNSSLVIFHTILSETVNDPVSFRERISCPKCKNKFAKSTRLGAEMRLVYICEKCKFQWIGV